MEKTLGPFRKNIFRIPDCQVCTAKVAELFGSRCSRPMMDGISVEGLMT